MNRKPLEGFSKKSEEAVAAYWKENDIANQCRYQHKASKKKYYMMDGPPYATGSIHMGTALNKTLKDVAMRSHRMQGFDVFDRPGYDTHGVPIEYKVEQKLGFKAKTDIEKFGVEKFIEECRQFASQYIPIMNQQFADLGVWMDWENPYITYKNEYIEAVWWTFKKAHEKDLLYLGLYPVHVCPHCETAVAFNEIEYVKQVDTSIYVKFRVKGKENEYLVIWTTTPWSLPGNTGVMVHPKYDYVRAQVGAEVWVIAQERLQQLMDAIEAGYAILETIKGVDLEGLEYEPPLADKMKMPIEKNGFRVVLSDRYVTVEDGTGLVHSAPGFGKEDFEVGQKNNLPLRSPINLDGSLKPETGKYAGKKARVVDREIIDDLKESNMLVYEHPYSHDYPVCWRDKSPLLQMSVPQWFFRISKIRADLVKENQTVTWTPNRMKGRMNGWLEGLSDWPISRSRFWGTPLPIWVCEKCDEKIVVGNKKELSQLTKIPSDLDLHKPWIDNITIPCKKCKGTARRVPHVMDVWFDSGVSSWAALGYPSQTDLFKEFWPADLNIEATDQFRGWWNSEMICSQICFDTKPFKAVAVHGMVLDLAKKKMSKSQGNIVSPMDVIEKYSRDYMRLYLCQVSGGEDIVFDWNAFTEIHKFFTILWNSYNYAALYLDLDFEKNDSAPFGLKHVEDEWIVSKTHSLILECQNGYNHNEYFKATDALQSFVTNDLSRTYIKLIRDRAKEGDSKQLSQVMSFALYSVIRLLAPMTPFLSEHFYLHAKSVKMPQSVHLMSLPLFDEKRVDKELEQAFEKSQGLIQSVLALREEQKRKLRWPLKELVIVTESGKQFSRVLSVIENQSNVKKVSESSKKPLGTAFAEKQGQGYSLFLDVSADSDLEDEWEYMELRRLVQEERKKAKLQPDQVVDLEIASSDPVFLKKFQHQLETEARVKVKPANGPMQQLVNKAFFIQLKP